jgi:hypothetical protein
VNEQERLLRDAVEAMAGKPCWSITPGYGTAVSLDFGRKIRRRTPLSNPNLTDEQRGHIGELVLFLTCPWKIEDAQGVICTDYEIGTQYFQEAQGLLLGSHVRMASVDPPEWNLEVLFETGHALRSYLGQAERNSSVDYSVFSPSHVVSVVGGEITAEPRVPS